MNSLFWIGGAALILAIVGAIFFFSRNPAWVAGLVKAFAAMAINALIPIILKRMPPEEEKAYHDANRKGLGWDFMRKRAKTPDERK